MTGLIKGALITICGLIPAGTVFFMMNASQGMASNVQAVVKQEDMPDISEIPEMTALEVQYAEVLAQPVLMNEFLPIQGIRQRDTLANVSFSEAMERTGLTREQINASLANNLPVEGYLFEFDHESAAIRVLTPPDTTVFPNMEEATVLTGLPKELIVLSIQEQKTVEGTKFEYEK